jgi:hypothetical protein
MEDKMNWELIAPWIMQIGMTLEFLSFWFAAPEILGEKRLKKYEDILEASLKTSRFYGILLAFLILVLIPTVYFYFSDYGVWPLAITSGLLLIMIIFIWIASKLLPILADDTRIRRRWIAIGAILFIAGFLLQMAATF